jgi:enoyl-CoA hydratase
LPVQICGHGVASDLVLTGRVMGAVEALNHGVVSRVVPREALDETVPEMAEMRAARIEDRPPRYIGS